MTHWSSYLLPFCALAIAVGTSYYKIDISTWHDLLLGMGLGGIPLSILKNAMEIKKNNPNAVTDLVKLVSDLAEKVAKIKTP